MQGGREAELMDPPKQVGVRIQVQQVRSDCFSAQVFEVEFCVCVMSDAVPDMHHVTDGAPVAALRNGGGAGGLPGGAQERLDLSLVAAL